MSDESQTEARLRQEVAQLHARLARLEAEAQADRLALGALQAELKDAQQANVALQESADSWRLLAENAPAYIMTVERDGTIRFINRDVPGFTVEEVIGSNVRKYLAPGDLDKALSTIESVFSTGEPGVYEVTIPTPDGKIVHYSTWVSPLKKGSEVVAAIEVTTDVTERKLAEEALRKSAASLSATLEATADGILALDHEGKPIFSNRHFAELWRIPQPLMASHDSGALKRHLLEQLADPDAFLSQMRRLFTSPEAGCGTVRCQDGRIFEHFSFPLQQDEPAPPGRVWSFRDVTERRQAEENLRQLRNYLSNIIDSMPSALVGVDPDGKVTQWNREAHRVTGISSDAATGRPLEQAFPRLAGEMRRVREAVQTRQAQTGPHRARRKAGETRYEDITIYPLVANGIDGAVIRVDDVTDKVRLEEMMVQSEKMLSVAGLAAGMAHEINNPLAGMIQTAGVVIDRLTDAELTANRLAAEQAGTSLEAIGAYVKLRKIDDMLGRIRASGDRAAAIVQNLLTFARKSDASWSSYGLADLLKQCVDLAGADYDLKTRLDFSQIAITWDCEENLPLVPCDAGKIRQVLLNILRNGAEAMHLSSKAGRQPPRFVFRLAHEREAGWLRLEIEDNGPGMTEEIRRRVFEPFFTTKPTNVGMGLGLSVSYFIITENHSGELSVESTPGQGTTLIIRLPVEAPPAGPDSDLSRTGSRAAA